MFTFSEDVREIPTKFSFFLSFLFFLRAHRTKDHTRKQEKVGIIHSHFHEKHMKIGIFLRNLDEILSEFHEHLQKMSKFAENCRKF